MGRSSTTSMAKRSLYAAALTATCVSATTMTFENQCTFTINLYDNKRTENIAAGGSTVRDIPSGYSGMFRHGTGDQATRTFASLFVVDTLAETLTWS
jgi:hypothetical protein